MEWKYRGSTGEMGLDKVSIRSRQGLGKVSIRVGVEMAMRRMIPGMGIVKQVIMKSGMIKCATFMPVVVQNGDCQGSKGYWYM